MERYIITHPGRSHRDEFLASCVAIANDLTINRIERRAATQSDLEDPEIYVIDIGKQHEPKLLNFDHHHFTVEDGVYCALSLILQHMGIYDMAKMIFPWLKFSEIMDVQGPAAAARACGVTGGAKSLLQFLSPVEKMLLREFEEKTIIKVGSTQFKLMKRLGNTLIADVSAVIERHRELAKGHNLLHMKVDGLKVVWVGIEDNPLFGLEPYLLQNGFEDVAITITKDDKGTGWLLYRRNNHPRVDFSKLEGNENILFIHNDGHLAKLKTKVDRDTLVCLVTKAAA